MNETILGNQLRKVPSIAVGCMRLSEKTKEEMNHFIHYALEQGAYFFDHADIYGGGMSETVFGDAFSHDPSLKREDVFLQSKCGIRQGCYDLSKEYILEAVDGILKRLRTDYLDLLLLHRPDALVEPEEVAAAFDVLFAAERSAILVFPTINQCRSHSCRSMSASHWLPIRYSSAFRFPTWLQMAWKSIWKHWVLSTTTEVCLTTAVSTTLPFRHGLPSRCLHGRAAFSEVTSTRN